MPRQSDIDNYHTLAGIVFVFTFLVHGTRALNGGDIFLGNWLIPMWLSYILIVATAYLAYQSFQIGR
jgi:hypothetical protein